MPVVLKFIAAIGAVAVITATAAPDAFGQAAGGRGGGSEGGGRSGTFSGARNGGGGRDFRVVIDGCIRVGAKVVVEGPMPAPPSGGAALKLGQRAIAMVPSSWDSEQMQFTVPPVALPEGEEIDVILPDGTRIGRAATCGGGDGGGSGGGTRVAGDPPPARAVAGGPVATAPDGRPEFVVAVPSPQAGTASAALQAQGAALLRTRVLASFGETLLVFALPAGLDPGTAQGVLDGAAPGALIAPHHLYGYAAGPRVYASTMVSGDECRLAGPVRIGVIDGPVDAGHPALAGLRVTSRAFVEGGAADHGTAVAALIAAAPSAGPLAGFAPGAEIYSAEVFGPDALASVELIGAGLDWLAAENVRLANLSFAGPWNRVLERIIADAGARGAVLVAAAGNDGSAAAALPAGAPGVIAVTAVDAASHAYAKANRGAHIAFAAPGVDLWTAKSGGGAYASGTSFAAPIVTAFAGRLLARNPSLSSAVVRDMLRDGAVDLGPPGHDPVFGWGLAQGPDC